MNTGRDGVIRTHDPLHPMQVRYQAALRPDEAQIIAEAAGFAMVFRCCNENLPEANPLARLELRAERITALHMPR
jgi:hypothetical protein